MDILFSAPVISCLIMAGCAAVGVSVVVSFLPQKSKLDTTVARAERALVKIRKQIAAKEASIKQLQSEVDMLRPLHARLSHYHEQLTQLRLETERSEMDDDEEQDEDDDLFHRRTRTKL